MKNLKNKTAMKPVGLEKEQSGGPTFLELL